MINFLIGLVVELINVIMFVFNNHLDHKDYTNLSKAIHHFNLDSEHTYLFRKFQRMDGFYKDFDVLALLMSIFWFITYSFLGYGILLILQASSLIMYAVSYDLKRKFVMIPNKR